MTRIKSIASRSLAAAIGLGLAAAAGAAHAQPVTVTAESPDDVLVEHVSYTDLDLASERDIVRLNLRVRGAVKRVCEPLNGRSAILQYSNCRSFARRGAEPQVKQAIARARELAQFGTTNIAPVAIVIAAPSR